ncbi:MAG: arginase family protein [Candidatus Aenigmarchaeota archaeon]|nr:arginase family protein [Candidatus Aenigmarchaeota archaeon]
MLHVSKSFTTEYALNEADVCVVGVPFDSTAIAHPLQRYGPTLIRAALKNVNFYISEKKKSVSVHIHDAGDVDVAPGSFEETDMRVRDTIRSLREQNPKIFPVILGGEHSVSLSVVRELKPKTIVSFDAHTDLSESYEGVAYSHATWLYHAARELGCNVVLLGVRDWTKEQEATMKKLGVATKLPKKLEGTVYVTVDVDVFDPAYAPETGFPEPGGLSPQEVFTLLDKIFKNNVIGFDIAEVASDRLGGVTANLAARTIVRALGNL